MFLDYSYFVLQGFSSGPYFLLSSIYIAECSEQDIRGTFGNIMPMMVTLGVLFVNGLGSFVQWMTLTGISIVFPALILVLMPFMPESPVYLIARQRQEEARKTLERLRGQEHDILSEIKQITSSLEKQEAVGSVNIKDMLTRREYVIPTTVSLLLMMIQQLSGVSAVMFYLGDIFLKAKTSINPNLQATLVALCQVTFNSVLILADRTSFSASVSLCPWPWWIGLAERDCCLPQLSPVAFVPFASAPSST